MTSIPAIRPAAPKRRFACLAPLLLAGLLVGATSAAAGSDVGLSSVRAQRLVDEGQPGFDPSINDFFGFAMVATDFDDDGAADLAIAAHGHDGPAATAQPSAGAVFIRPGATTGVPLATVESVLGEFVAGSPSVPSPNELAGAAVAACDFNGDTFVDLAIGVPGEADGNQPSSGAILVFDGAAQGLTATNPLYLAQSSAGVPGASTSGDFFGVALACGDFDHDLFADLAVGVPLKDYPDGANDAGWVVILRGSAGGLGQIAGFNLDQATPGVPDDVELDDQFGYPLAVGNFNGDAYADLAVGVVGENSGAGAVHVFFGGAGGLSATGTLFLTESSVGGTSEALDNFGFALATGDFDGDTRSDLAIGIPYETIAVPGGDVAVAGQVAVVYGTAAGGFDRFSGWTEDTLLGAGATEFNDLFGWALATGDFDGDGHDDLAAGAPVEDQERGAVVVWMGSGSGLSNARVREFIPGVDGIPVGSDATGEFGFSLASGDFDGDGHADLAICAPFENIVERTGAGSVTILYGSLFSDGFESHDTAFWSAVAP